MPLIVGMCKKQKNVICEGDRNCVQQAKLYQILRLLWRRISDIAYLYNIVTNFFRHHHPKITQMPVIRETIISLVDIVLFVSLRILIMHDDWPFLLSTKQKLEINKSIFFLHFDELTHATTSSEKQLEKKRHS